MAVEDILGREPELDDERVPRALGHLLDVVHFLAVEQDGVAPPDGVAHVISLGAAGLRIGRSVAREERAAAD